MGLVLRYGAGLHAAFNSLNSCRILMGLDRYGGLESRLGKKDQSKTIQWIAAGLLRKSTITGYVEKNYFSQATKTTPSPKAIFIDGGMLKSIAPDDHRAHITNKTILGRCWVNK